MDDFLTSCTVHLENVESLSYAGLLNVDNMSLSAIKNHFFYYLH